MNCMNGEVKPGHFVWFWPESEAQLGIVLSCSELTSNVSILTCSSRSWSNEVEVNKEDVLLEMDNLKGLKKKTLREAIALLATYYQRQLAQLREEMSCLRQQGAPS